MGRGGGHNINCEWATAVGTELKYGGLVVTSPQSSDVISIPTTREGH